MSDREAEVGGAGQEVDAGSVAGGSSEGVRTVGIEEAGERFEGVTPYVEPVVERREEGDGEREDRRD